MARRSVYLLKIFSKEKRQVLLNAFQDCIKKNLINPDLEDSDTEKRGFIRLVADIHSP